MENKIYISNLFDLYEGLLTDKINALSKEKKNI